ncbi:MAG: ATP-binding protein [Spirochaetaceae bacterium]|nr:ATP-binding protein [Spirochaetaceae bacterium]
MDRKIVHDLLKWKDSPTRKPMILKGARQVGKTWAVLDFASKYYIDKGYKFHYIDFSSSKNPASIFEDTNNPEEIIKLLQLHTKTPIDISNDLLILDEIQECPKAISSLKYFKQEMNNLDIIAAGSHLGLLKSSNSFPVGKVDFLYMFPLTFEEFIAAADKDLFSFFDKWKADSPLPQLVHNKLLEFLQIYLFTGGLPEVLDTWINYSGNIVQASEEVRKVQKNLIEGYRSDFAKYSGLINANHINHVFNSVTSQLSKAHDTSVKKFTFKSVIPNRKGFDSISGPLNWLKESRLIIKTGIINRAEHPLKSYINVNRFKAYLFDTGLLNCILEIPSEVILQEKLGSYKGFILENFAAQELFAVSNSDLVSWQEGSAEIEFIFVKGKDIIPVEVKSSNRTRRAKSLDSFIRRYSPNLAIKMSRQNYGYSNQRNITTLPIYALEKITISNSA